MTTTPEEWLAAHPEVVEVAAGAVHSHFANRLDWVPAYEGRDAINSILDRVASGALVPAEAVEEVKTDQFCTFCGLHFCKATTHYTEPTQRPTRGRRGPTPAPDSEGGAQ